MLRKINSFTQKPSIAQITSYIMIPLDIVVFYSCVIPNLSDSLTMIVLASVFGAITLALVISTLVCSIHDPTDSIVNEYREVRRLKYVL